jgi:tripartite-type tricarboxylate transporter receptor subunit TctC
MATAVTFLQERPPLCAGNSPHSFLEMLNQMTGIKTEAVQHKGSAPALTGPLSGDVEFSARSIATARGQLESGKALALAVTSGQPVAKMAHVLPVTSLVPGCVVLTFNGPHAPASALLAIVGKTRRDAAAALQRPDVRETLTASSMDASVTTTEEPTNCIRQQTDRWAEVIRSANIRTDSGMSSHDITRTCPAAIPPHRT